MSELLEALRAIQEREDLNDGQMAVRLQIARPTWNGIRNGHLPLTERVAVRAVRAWPELTRHLLELAAAS